VAVLPAHLVARWLLLEHVLDHTLRPVALARSGSTTMVSPTFPVIRVTQALWPWRGRKGSSGRVRADEPSVQARAAPARLQAAGGTRYVFRPPGAAKAEVDRAIAGRVLAVAELVGVYER
jgi:hypothetical protein